MPALTRKRVNDRPVAWHVHYAGVRVGMILERFGVANTAEPWEWHCGVYPGRNLASSDTDALPASRPRVRNLKQRGGSICPSAARPTSGNGAIARHPRAAVSGSKLRLVIRGFWTRALADFLLKRRGVLCWQGRKSNVKGRGRSMSRKRVKRVIRRVTTRRTGPIDKYFGDRMRARRVMMK
jgi:hypothetical protein